MINLCSELQFFIYSLQKSQMWQGINNKIKEFSSTPTGKDQILLKCSQNVKHGSWNLKGGIV
jgi:hypothetical protein